MHMAVDIFFKHGKRMLCVQAKELSFCHSVKSNLDKRAITQVKSAEIYASKKNLSLLSIVSYTAENTVNEAFSRRIVCSSSQLDPPVFIKGEDVFIYAYKA